jgi:formate hydrogenlyase subunit 6/NADH:ubiquinone oxidoreductase subunit I
VNACPADAIAFEGEEESQLITHAGETCVKCGLCLRVCPVEAFTGDNGVPNLLPFVSRQEKHAIVELACALNPNKELGPPQADVVVNTGACLAALGPSAIMALMALGVAHVILRVDACQTCPLAQSRAEIDKTVDQVDSLLKADEGLGSPLTLLDTIRDDWPRRFVAAIKAPPKSRRDFFRAFTVPEEVPTEVQQLILAERPEEDKYPPSERLRLLRALNSVPEDLLAAEPLELFPSSKLAADENCTACNVCARACPTGALHFTVDDEDRYQLALAAGLCTDCGVCQSLCEADALHKAGVPVLNDWLAEEPFMLRQGDLSRCRKCGAGFDSRTKSNLCQVCDFRQSNPFGSRLPKGFKRQKEAPQKDDVRH